MNLGVLLKEAARRHPDSLAVSAPDGALSFAELDALSNQMTYRLASAGVRAGDRVAVWLPKGVAALAAMQGALRLGAAYVPCDPLSPEARVRTIISDCSVRVLVAEGRPGRRVLELLTGDRPVLVTPEDAREGPQWTGGVADVDARELAYILYTSGSTGRPKGVCISHRAALAFIRWAAQALELSPDDRLSNHAPFHFDLSVLDIYAAWLVGACVVVVPEALAYNAQGLSDFIVFERISVWYSVPSALMLMMDKGELLPASIDHVRVVLFAGEPFPIKHLRALRERLPRAGMWNLYGPTETNVCTAYEVGQVAPDRLAPVPIGSAVCGDTVWALDDEGREVPDGERGELWVSGPTVMNGYWGREPHGDRPYRTGDLVVRTSEGVYEYVGRRDHMVKVRGYRVELGEIESVLQSHDAIREVAVSTEGEGLSARLVAFIACEGRAPSLLDLKRMCAQKLPRYMIVDQLRTLDALPRTRNGKVDRAALSSLAPGDGASRRAAVEK